MWENALVIEPISPWRVRAAGALTLAMLVSAGKPASAQSDADTAIMFFQGGGSYCFRVVPEGVSLSDETTWTFVVLTSVANTGNAFRARTIDPGETRLAGQALTDVGMAITNVWRREGLREEFFTGFAAGIASGGLRARLARISPPRLAEMKPRQRAELYLRFTDRGTKVDFRGTADLTPDGWLAFQSYLQD